MIVIYREFIHYCINPAYIYKFGVVEYGTIEVVIEDEDVVGGII